MVCAALPLSFCQRSQSTQSHRMPHRQDFCSSSFHLLNWNLTARLDHLFSQSTRNEPHREEKKLEIWDLYGVMRCSCEEPDHSDDVARV